MAWCGEEVIPPKRKDAKRWLRRKLDRSILLGLRLSSICKFYPSKLGRFAISVWIRNKLRPSKIAPSFDHVIATSGTRSELRDECFTQHSCSCSHFLGQFCSHFSCTELLQRTSDSSAIASSTIVLGIDPSVATKVAEFAKMFHTNSARFSEKLELCHFPRRFH